jgi:hypothetical protein
MIKTYNVLSSVAPFALDTHQFLGIDVVAVMGGVSTCVSAARAARHHPRAIVFKPAEKHSAAFMGIGLFAVEANRVVIRAGEFQHGKSFRLKTSDFRSQLLKTNVVADSKQSYNLQSEIKNLK